MNSSSILMSYIACKKHAAVKTQQKQTNPATIGLTARVQKTESRCPAKETSLLPTVTNIGPNERGDT